jgi:hypothetical protein
MIHSTKNALQTAALALLSAVFFVVFFHLNLAFFSALEYREGVNWVFLPAGFRVILVLVAGVPGSMGIMLGTWFIDRTALGSDLTGMVLANGLVSGFTPWLVLKFSERWGVMSPQLQQLTTQQLLNFTLMYAAANALAHHASWWLFKRADLNVWVDVWPMFVGDAIGALLMLYGFKFVLNKALRKQKAIES